MRIKKEIHAVHDDQLSQMIESLGLQGKIKHEKIKCKFCKSVITLNNINAIFPESGSIKIACDKPICVSELASYLQDHEF